MLKAIQAVFLSQAIAWPESGFSATNPAASAEARRTLASFVDVLLPRDAQSGSASDLKVDKELWIIAGEDRQFSRLLSLGCQWLNMSDGGQFSALSNEQQIALVRWMSESAWDQIPRRFYELVRQASLELYFSQPNAWHGLAMMRPPQPMGYPPPWQ